MTDAPGMSDSDLFPRTETVPLSSLRKTDLLRRRHGRDQMDRCVHSLMRYGQRQPLVVSGDEVLCGTLLYDAMRRLKWKEATVRQLGPLPLERRRELRYLDNRVFEMSRWRDEDVKIFLMGLDSGGLEDCGFTEDEAERIVNGFVEDGRRASRKLRKAVDNSQPDTWCCPSCGWTGMLSQSAAPVVAPDGKYSVEVVAPGEDGMDSVAPGSGEAAEDEHGSVRGK